MPFCRAIARFAPLVLVVLITSSLATGAAAHGQDEDPFLSQVRPTEPLAPADEHAAFRLPAGFEIQLVAAEPEIQKPLNMAFDARGRLWVACTVEYPYAAPADRPARDSIRVLEDTDGDGRADQVTTFADGLNIPLGLYPYKRGVIAFSIPHIYYLEDTDGDGRADRREILFGPFDHTRDTHGLNNAFHRGPDGWIYACHGFNNHSQVAGRDGKRMDLESGNIYRFRPDGSAIEQFTWGQVNPFGLTLDPAGDWFSADCHTKPITLLLRGGYYESFGKPHDGLGFVPNVMEHLHGSTAIAGIACNTGGNFPAEYQESFFTGNVMTSRVHRDVLQRLGSTRKALEQPDLVTTSDPWFRPVDLQFGPDGALYIADFYNRIIGHYEVPLDHPGRDRERGRIWRVVYKGESGQALAPPPDLASADGAQLIAALDHPNLVVRMRATDELSDRLGAAAVDPLAAALRNGAGQGLKIYGRWALLRLGALGAEQLSLAAGDSDPFVRIHAMRMLSETAELTNDLRSLVAAGLKDSSPDVRRAAADAAGRHPDLVLVPGLADVLREAPENDVHLRHAGRIALRDQFRPAGALARWRAGEPDALEQSLVAEIALGLTGEDAGSFLLDRMRRGEIDPAMLGATLGHAARNLPATNVDELAALVQERAPHDLDLQLELLSTVHRGITQRGLAVSPAVRGWGLALARRLFDSAGNEKASWAFVATLKGSANPWDLELRDSADGKKATLFLSSLPHGEQLTGVLRSPTFTLPAALRFFICGHLGFPDKPAIEKNLVRLCLADSGDVVRQVLAPRHDVARQVEWDLAEYAGQQAYVEVVDGIDVEAYAWVAVGRFDPPVIQVPDTSPNVAARRQAAAAQTVETLQLAELRPELEELLLAETAQIGARAAAARALLSLTPDERLKAAAVLIDEPEVDAGLRDALCQAIAAGGSDQTDELLAQAMRGLPGRLQAALAEGLAGSAAGAAVLLDLVERGQASARLLRSAQVADKLKVSGLADLEPRVEALVASLPPAQEETERLLAERLGAYDSEKASARRGLDIFVRHCASCHQVRGRGFVVGPQLDGIGNRGLARVLEDVLDPNRNVDVSFRAVTYEVDDGRILVGLPRREEGQNLVIADNAGKELSISRSEIVQEQKSANSLMPDNVATLVAGADFNDLVAFLLAQRQEPDSGIAWNATCVDSVFRSEGVAVADVNRDGKQDILAGEVWYEAPDWKMHEIYAPGDYGDGAASYSSSFLCYADDINHDDWPDLIVIGFPGQPCNWYENPRGQPGHWPAHLIATSACNETPLYADLFATSKRVLVMGVQPQGEEQQGQMMWLEPGSDPTMRWRQHPISEPSRPGQEVPGTQRFSHGLGVDDINGDGRADVLCTGGWWEQPAAPAEHEWKFHPASLGEACANMFTTDVNGDGLADVLSSSAHQFGIWCHEQQAGDTGEGMFTRHDLFPDLLSQTHALRYEDIDGDGLKDLITGKRWWAHGPSGDPGSDQPAVLYWFQAQRDASGPLRFVPRLIHDRSGVGLQFEVRDFNGDGNLDVITSNKKGTWLFEQVRAVK